jgi:hypothetical protein
MTTEAVVLTSSELVMVMALVVVVVVVSKQFDTLRVHSSSLCGHRGKPMPLVPEVPHAQAQVNHGFSYLPHHRRGRYPNRHTSRGDAARCSNGMRDHYIAAVALLDLDIDMTGVGQASDSTTR